MTDYDELDDGRFDACRPINHASGAALVTRSDLVRQLGLFDPALFLYLEDTAFGWKLRQQGQEIVYVPQSVVHHKYTFKADFRHYYYLERNRWWLLLVYYKLRTLALIAPALGLMELGQLVFSARKGRLFDKLRSYAYFLSPRNLRTLRTRRHQAQSQRTVSDRQFLDSFTGSIDFAELDSPLVRWVADPVFSRYWAVVRHLILW
jgi:GT2 family glycosyltransferase